jgi:hypothetical protein
MDVHVMASSMEEMSWAGLDIFDGGCRLGVRGLLGSWKDESRFYVCCG